MPAISASVVIMIGRSRTRPASMIAVRRSFPDSWPHFAKSISRIAFFATMPMSRITPISDMMFSVPCVMSSASTTPISERGSEIMIASGSRNEPNWITRIRYIRSTAMPMASNMRLNTCCWSFTSPPAVIRYPVGSANPASLAVISAFTSPSERPCVLASTTTTLSRSRWLMIAGPSPADTVAICPSGITVSLPPAAPPPTTSGSRSMSEIFVRASGVSRIRTFLFSPAGSTQSPASIPANAGLSDCATCPTVTPIEPASARLRLISSSGLCPFVESPTSTAFGTLFTIFITESASRLSITASAPRSSTWICLRIPPKPLVNT